ncbi:hypothetical protein, partial [Actinosynnema sp.]
MSTTEQQMQKMHVMSRRPAPTSDSGGAGSGFSMNQSDMETLRKQAEDLGSSYKEIAAAITGASLSGNAFGQVGAEAVERFNVSSAKGGMHLDKISMTMGKVAGGIQATAQDHAQTDDSNNQEFAGINTETDAQAPAGAGGAGGSGATGQGA